MEKLKRIVEAMFDYDEFTLDRFKLFKRAITIYLLQIALVVLMIVLKNRLWFFITNIAELVFCTFLYLAFFDYIKTLIPEAMILVISGLIGLIVGIMGYIAFHFDYLTIALYIGIRETPKIVGLLIAFRSL